MADAGQITSTMAPLRLGLAGGGTDLSAYCKQYGGAILNVTIDRHAYAFVYDSEDENTHFAALDIDIKKHQILLHVLDATDAQGVADSVRNTFEPDLITLFGEKK